MSVAGINGTANYPVYTPGKATGKVSNNNFSQQINHAKAGNVHTFADTVKQTTGSDSVSRTEAYKDYLKQKYGMDVAFRAGKSMSGSDVVIAPNILEEMANNPEKAAYYEGKIDDFFNATPMLKASFAAQRKAGLERSQEEAVVQSAVRLVLMHLPICRGHRTCLDTKGYSNFYQI